eukprot:991398-Amphidinium_carterae.1
MDKLLKPALTMGVVDVSTIRDEHYAKEEKKAAIGDAYSIPKPHPPTAPTPQSKTSHPKKWVIVSKIECSIQ